MAVTVEPFTSLSHAQLQAAEPDLDVLASAAGATRADLALA